MPQPRFLGRTGVPVTLALMAAVSLPSALPGQERGEGSTSCTLRWASLTDSTASRSIQVGPDRYRHHVWNGMRWTCGDAVMTADSAVQFPGDRVEMMGSVHYRDSIRTLDARRLTYFQRTDLVEARESVRLVRRATGSTLRAPSVDFYRAGSGEVRQTVATGGARMVVYPPADEEEETAEEERPFHVTSDTAIILQDDVTLARGDVEVTRDGMRGTGAFGRFDMEGGEGMLTGDPALTGEDYRLTGDTVHISTEEGDLREVRADGSGHLESEGLDVRGPHVRVAVRQEEVRTLWAYGGGARSRSATRLMLGDSLRFDFMDGEPDSAAAVGEAAAVELAPGDTLVLEDLAAGPEAADTTATAGAEGPAVDTAAAAPRDSLVPGGAAAEVAPDSADPSSPAQPPAAGLFGLGRDWIRGDTVRAFFARADGAEGAGAAAAGDTTGAAEDPAGTAQEVTLREMRAIGNARAYYRVARDTMPATDSVRLGRNYMLGRRITIAFREGDPHRVVGTQAIGVYLEPAAPGQGSAPGPAPPPDTAAPGEALPGVVPPDSILPDTATVARDTTPGGS